ncbi:MAG: hypothetical protein CL398_11495 [Acidiferrobacteraceae bacterium]|nr:hypothetical protein [Acidiferrobacteraceae bacterium]
MICVAHTRSTDKQFHVTCNQQQSDTSFDCDAVRDYAKLGTMKMTSIAKRLSKLRTKKGLNQSQLARTVGVTRAAVSRWEQGDIDSILARNAIRVAHALGTSVEFLFTGRHCIDQTDLDALSRSIKIVDQALTDNISSTGKATITSLVYQLIINGETVSKTKVRQLKAAA